MAEKRKQERIDHKMKSEVHNPEGMTFSTTMNIGHGGVFISTPEPLEPGSEVELNLYFAKSEPIKLKGIVKWSKKKEDSEQDAIGMGVEFSEHPDSLLRQLKKIT
jgi:uncharacterized protein (TIGR02266 family)